jgi:hypothetical protein
MYNPVKKVIDRIMSNSKLAIELNIGTYSLDRHNSGQKFEKFAAVCLYNGVHSSILIIFGERSIFKQWFSKHRTDLCCDVVFHR